MGRKIATAVGQTLQQQYPTGRQGRGKNEFINSTFHQLNGPSICIRILQNTSADSEFIFGKNQTTAQSRQSETLAKTDKQSCDTGYSKGLRNPIYFAAKAINATRFVSVNQKIVKPSGSGGPWHVEEGCYSSFGSQRGPISQLFVSCEKERWGEECILCNPPVSEIQEVCHILVKRPSIRVLLPLLRDFSSSSGFSKAIKVPISLYLRKAQCKTNNLPRRHATNSIFIRGIVEPTSTLEFFVVIVNSGEMTLSLPKEKLLKVQENHFQEILEKGKVTVRELNKLTGRLSSTAMAVLPAPLHHHHLQHQQIQKLICHNSFEENLAILVEARKELLWRKENLTLCNGRSLISPLPQITISSNLSLQGWGKSCHDRTTGGPWSMEE